MTDNRAQVQVLEAIIVGVVVFIAIALTAIFRLPTSPGTFQQTELERLGSDTLVALAAKPPLTVADCNDPAPCPFQNELERILSLALRYEGLVVSGTGEIRDTDPFSDYFNQSLPDGSRYILYYSNGVNATSIYPINLVAPRLDVVVAHAFIAPNWTVNAANLAASVLVRINEITGFEDADTDKIFDPLNREKDEWTATQKSRFANAGGSKAVPIDALYGTYKLCPPAGACSYFTVVPQGVFAAGASILSGDRDNSSSILPIGALPSYANYFKYVDTSGDTLVSAGEGLYIDTNGNSVVNAGDVRLSSLADCTGASTATCAAGTFVRTVVPAQADIGAALTALPGTVTIRHFTGDGDASLDEAEGVYLDVDNSGSISAIDRRLSRVGTFAFGSEVVGTDADVTGGTLSAVFTSATVQFGDTDGNTGLDAGEPVYLDLEGRGQSIGLQALDLHLTPLGSPTVRYLYDIQAVIWYGV